jgi:signal transduction histidine kinase
MSYRALKRLLGETSLERKCHLLFGTFSVLLITVSFLLYARQTEHLAYEQINTACRLLVAQIVDQQINTSCRPLKDGRPVPLPQDEPRRAQARAEFREEWEKTWPAALREYRRTIITPGPHDDPGKVPDQASQAKIKEFQANPSRQEDSQLLLSQGKNHYYGAVRAGKSCLGCHQELRAKSQEKLQEGDLLAVIKIEVPTDSIAEEFHTNRAILISTAFVTVLLLMFGNYVIVRYVIVKPAKHLKEVADAISAGELNLRSEIQTGDEFEDLSHAFNRMLRSLVAMQERLRKVNNDLDRNVDDLAQANLALFESNRLKSDFLATVSHELKTPLHSILGFSDVLQASAGLTEKQQRWVANIRASGEQLMNLIGDILDLAKIEAGKMHASVTTFDVADVCDGMLTMFRPMAEKKNIDLRVIYGPDLPPLRQDAVKLRQVLVNLLSNAVKFTPEGGRVTLKAEADGGQVVLTVQDTGVGIAAEEQEAVFEKFRQAGTSLITREHGGTGLGLSIVRELTRLLGGGVTLQSELGRGSTFTVRLPVALSEEPRLEFDLAHEGIDLSKAQRIDVRLYQGAEATATTPAGPPTSAEPESGKAGVQDG